MPNASPTPRPSARRAAISTSLKSLEPGVPEPLLARWRELQPQLAARRVLLHQGVPLFPVGPWMLYAVLLLVLGPIVLAGATANLPPLFAAWLVARKRADDLNVIALWRILIGLPVFLVWFGVVSVSLALVAGWFWLVGYVLLTLLALKALYRVKKLAVAVWNGLAHRNLAVARSSSTNWFCKPCLPHELVPQNETPAARMFLRRVPVRSVAAARAARRPVRPCCLALFRLFAGEHFVHRLVPEPWDKSALAVAALVLSGGDERRVLHDGLRRAQGHAAQMRRPAGVHWIARCLA